MNVLGLDPGTRETGWCVYDSVKHEVRACGIDGNAAILSRENIGIDLIAIEMIASYGMAVGRDVFETVWWIGRFYERFHEHAEITRVYRKDVKLSLCGTPQAKDANIRQALIDLFPPTGGGKTPQIGTKKEPGPLYGVRSHIWPALGVALTAFQSKRQQEVGLRTS